MDILAVDQAKGVAGLPHLKAGLTKKIVKTRLEAAVISALVRVLALLFVVNSAFIHRQIDRKPAADA